MQNDEMKMMERFLVVDEMTEMVFFRTIYLFSYSLTRYFVKYKENNVSSFLGPHYLRIMANLPVYQNCQHR